MTTCTAATASVRGYPVAAPRSRPNPLPWRCCLHSTGTSSHSCLTHLRSTYNISDGHYSIVFRLAAFNSTQPHPTSPLFSEPFPHPILMHYTACRCSPFLPSAVFKCRHHTQSIPSHPHYNPHISSFKHVVIVITIININIHVVLVIVVRIAAIRYAGRPRDARWTPVAEGKPKSHCS